MAGGIAAASPGVHRIVIAEAIGHLLLGYRRLGRRLKSPRRRRPAFAKPQHVQLGHLIFQTLIFQIQYGEAPAQKINLNRH
jgi:hypothetical protein